MDEQVINLIGTLTEKEIEFCQTSEELKKIESKYFKKRGIFSWLTYKIFQQEQGKGKILFKFPFLVWAEEAVDYELPKKCNILEWGNYCKSLISQHCEKNREQFPLPVFDYHNFYKCLKTVETKEL